MFASADLLATLARTATPAMAQGHHQWWRRWRDRVSGVHPELRGPTADERSETDPAGATHVFESSMGVRVGGRLIEPAGAPRGAVVLLHGYGAREALADRHGFAGNLAVLKLRVRGFPGSRLDAGALGEAQGGWIAQGLGDAAGAALTGAVADVVLSARALRRRYGAIPVTLRGDSFGGGLAVIAAAQALDDAPFDRLAIGVPSLGDWTLRLLSERPAGATADAARAQREATDQAALRRTLRLTDAATHARRVQRPTLCLLAADDPVVPPATAAAIYNALGSDPGLKRRVIVERAHQALTTGDLRRVAAFERLASAFLDPANDPMSALSASLEL